MTGWLWAALIFCALGEPMFAGLCICLHWLGYSEPPK